MAAKESDQAQPQGTALPQTGLPGPDAMLGLWSSWLSAHTGPKEDWFTFSKPWWQIAPDAAGNQLAAGMTNLADGLGKDPVLSSIDEVWRANPLRKVIPVDWAEIARALRAVWLRSLAQPDQAVKATAELGTGVWNAAIEVWNEAGRRWWSQGELAAGDGKPQKGGDRRFSAPEWQHNPVYRTVRDAYLLASDWLLKHADTLDMDPSERQRINFHLRQFVDAVSPTLLLTSNPVALRRAVETGGASLAQGTCNLLADLKQGHLSMVDETAFAPGRNLALSPGKVVHRNKLIELIQYSPKTDTVYQTPLLFFPPWINKFYILDLQPKNSMVQWLVEQGFTIFVVSWKNPDASMDGVTIEDYLDLGPLEAIDAVRDITGSPQVNTMGYCIGGTLQAMALAWLAARNDDRIKAATFVVSLQDFSHVGDTAIFMGEENIDFIEEQMMQRGYLDSREMANMFNLLRANDLIWSNVVNNYLLGQKPPAFDLLYWNSDGTRMTPTAHSWYLRNTYIENNLIVPGKVELKGEKLDLGKIKQDIYAVGAEADHIVPWQSAWRIGQVAGGKVRYVRASSGHIAGIINPPGGKGKYWTAESGKEASPDAWLSNATEHNGSWWTDWKDWLAAHSGDRVRLPPLGNEKHPPLADAPGTYVMEK